MVCFYKPSLVHKFLLDETCQTGSATGDTIKIQQLTGLYTLRECITAVRQQHPIANGIQITSPCPNNCSCYAVYGMTGWNTTSSYTSCLLTRGNVLNKSWIDEGSMVHS